MSEKNNNAIALLTAAAAGLVGLSNQSTANEIATDYQFGVRHHNYQEDSLPNALGGSQDRYDIDVNQFSLIAPINESMDMSISYQNETMSGASPWYTIQDAEGNTTQIMSGASIEDERTDASVRLRLKNELNSYGVVIAVSDEDDYSSQAIGFEFSQEAEDKMSSWSIAADVSNDDVFPVDADIYTTRPITEQSKRSVSGFLSFTQIISKHSLIQLGVGYNSKSGYLSDPYKVVLVDFNLIADARPDSKVSKTLSARYRYFLDNADAALHIDYRYYQDDWDIDSNTLEIAWYQNLPLGIQIIPSVRAYSQSEAYFYADYYKQARADGYYSTDYRLSEYGAITAGVKLIKNFETWSVTASYQQYSSGGDQFLANAETENPALLDFQLVTVGFNFSF